MPPAGGGTRHETQRSQLDDVRRRHAENWRDNRVPSAQSRGQYRDATVAPSEQGAWRGVARAWQWAKRHRWLLGFAAGCAVGVYLRPGAPSFKSYLRTRHSGEASSIFRNLYNLLGVPDSSLYTSAQVTSLGVLSVAKYRGQLFVGLLGAWVPLPHLQALRLRGLTQQEQLDLLVLSNAAVWLAWQVAPERWMSKHFVASSWNALRRPHTLVTAGFSHQSVAHLTHNMQSLLAVAPILQASLGSGHFLTLYLGGALASSLTTILSHRASGREHGGSLGASGAVLAVLACNAALYPKQTYAWFGGLELNAPQLLAANALLDVLTYESQDASLQERRIDVWGHLGGVLFGMLYYQSLIRRP